VIAGGGATVVELLEYHDLAPSRHTPPVPLVRRAARSSAIRPAPVLAVRADVDVVHGDSQVGLRRAGVTYWQVRRWT
jgi:hypothetical protein